MHIVSRLVALSLGPILVSYGAAAQPDARVKAAKKGEASPYFVSAEGGSGLGVFQDIQVPFNDASQMRGDGKLTSEENADHAGFPLYLGVGFAHRLGALTLDLAEIKALQMRATTGPAETQSSSYSRLELSTGATYERALLGAYTGAFGLTAALRRSSFNNISSSHYVEAAMIGASVALETSGYALSLGFAVAPRARFGYSEDAVLGGRAFARSAATMNEVDAKASWPVGEGVYLDTSIAREAARVTVSDLTEYNQFGLNVEDVRRPTRVYELATTVARIGIRKEF